jgi:hypothetical protein
LFSLCIVSYGFWFKGEFREGWSRHALKGDTGHADPNKRRKKRGKLYFSSTKALKTIRMGRKKVAPEPFEKNGLNKVLDFENTGDNVTLSTVDETEGPLMSRGRGSQSQGASKDVGTQSNPAYNPTSEEQSAKEEFEETSLMDTEGG